MAKKKRGGHAGGHGWFVTFADLMALLLSYFVMLVAFSNQDSAKLKIVAGSMREAFGVQTAARGHGLHTCPQFAFTQFHRIISEQLALPPEQKVLCGMSLGHEDTSAVENTLVSERAALSEWASFHSG